MYCRRIDAAKTLFAADGDGSSRAELVLGVQDGIVRWFFNRFSEILIPAVRNGDICLEGGSQGLAEILESSDVDEVVRTVVERMGTQGDVSICLWNPRKYKHNISTLILKGKADPIIAGCQAEEVFKSGLEGERALIEFPGVGHSMVLPLVQDGEHDEKTLAIKGPDNTKIIGKFLETPSVKDFKVELTEADPPKLAVLEALRATIWMAEGQSISVWPAGPTSDNNCFNRS
jgi:hypothetical protein